MILANKVMYGIFSPSIKFNTSPTRTQAHSRHSYSIRRARVTQHLCAQLILDERLELSLTAGDSSDYYGTDTNHNERTECLISIVCVVAVSECDLQCDAVFDDLLHACYSRY